MDLYARVNILGGRAVRLPRGDINQAIALDADPLAWARRWVGRGAPRLLIVDLDAAARRDGDNRSLIHRMLSELDVPIQVAGGIRSPGEVDRMLTAGAWRVAMGTAAIENQNMVWELCRLYPDRISVSLDVLEDEELATRGWTSNSGRFLEEVLIELSSAGVASFMVAEAGRDTLAEPPNFDVIRTALATVEQPVIAAGGVRNLADLTALTELESSGRRLAGVVVGREVTVGRFSMEDAAEVLARADERI